MNILIGGMIFGGSGGGGSTFVPTDLTSLILWGEADTSVFTDTGGTTPVASDGDSVKNWKDLSGVGQNVVWPNAGGSAPVWKTNLSNGKPGIRFSGVDGCILQSSQSNNQKPVSCGLVIKASSGVAMDGWSNQGGFQLQFGGGSVSLVKASVVAIGNNTSTLSTSVYYIIIVTYDGSGNYAFTTNGSADGSGTNDQTFTDTSTRVGGYHPGSGGGSVLNGDILAFCKGSVVWSGTEITNLTNYWKAKYGL